MHTPTERQQRLADLLRRRRTELDMSQGDVAAAVRALLPGERFTQQSYAAIEAGKTKRSKFLPQIAHVLGLKLEELDFAPFMIPHTQKDSGAYAGQAHFVGHAGRKLPVIGSVAAGTWCEAIEEFQPGDAEEWIDSPGPVGPRAFILRIDGISMYNPQGSVSFADGDRVVIDPSIEARPGDFVCAKLAGSNRATFKRLQQDEGEWYLEAINPSWEPRYIRVNEEWHVCGKALWKVQKL